jgi:predicted dehydrogenase
MSSSAAGESIHRVVVVGAESGQGDGHADLLPADVELVGVAGDAESAIETMDFDLAIVTGSPPGHFEASRQLLSAGRHVVKEPPLALTSAEAYELAAVARARQVGLFTMVRRSYRATLRQARAMWDQIGVPCRFSFEYQPCTVERRAAHGGALMDPGYEVVDVVRALFGAPDDLDPWISYSFGAAGERERDDVARVALRYRGQDRVGWVHVSRGGDRPCDRLEVTGTDGSMVVEPGTLTLYTPGGRQLVRVEAPVDERADTAAMLSDYVRLLGRRNRSLAHLAAHVDNVALIERAHTLVTAAQLPPAGSEPPTLDPSGEWRPAGPATARVLSDLRVA